MPIEPTSKRPDAPTGNELVKLIAGCERAGTQWNGPGGFDLHWLVDPPPFESTIEVLRQWLIQVDSLVANSTLDIKTLGAGAAQQTRVSGTGARASIEVVTPSTQTLRVEVGGNAAVNARQSQRLLLATDAADLGAPIGALARTGDGAIAALTTSTITLLTPEGVVLGRTASQGATALVRDAHGVVAWGPTGAFRIGALAMPLTDRAVRAITRDVDGTLVLHTADRQLAVQGGRVTLRAAELHTIGTAAVAPTPAVQAVTLRSDRVIVAIGSRVLITRPWGERRNIVA
jgi:hypothetical protein